MGSHGLDLGAKVYDPDHARGCRYNYLCETCMKNVKNLPGTLKNILENSPDDAKAIIEYYDFLKAANNEPGGRLAKAVYTGLKSGYNHSGYHNEPECPKEPEFFTRVPELIMYLESHGLDLGAKVYDPDHARGCRYNYLCETCMKNVKNLPGTLKNILENSPDDAKAIVEYYDFLKAANNEPGGRLAKAVYTGLKSGYNHSGYHNEP